MLKLALLMIAAATAAHAQTVTDGDTIKLDGVTYRIWGIDAPESRQICSDEWEAGKIAAAYLYGLIRGHNVECEPKTKDRYGRTVALCRADGRDLGADMVAAGMALAFTRYSVDYVDHERGARAARLGIHAHVCEAPGDWRARQRNPKQ